MLLSDKFAAEKLIALCVGSVNELGEHLKMWFLDLYRRMRGWADAACLCAWASRVSR
jgi:hypothetical protein